MYGATGICPTFFDETGNCVIFPEDVPIMGIRRSDDDRNKRFDERIQKTDP